LGTLTDFNKQRTKQQFVFEIVEHSTSREVEGSKMGRNRYSKKGASQQQGASKQPAFW
jgi:hypothetical protein